MLLTLIKIRIKALLSGVGSGSKKKTTKGSKILYALIAIYVLVVFLGLFGIIFYRICDAFIAMGLGWLYFAFMGLMIFFLCFIGSVFATQNLHRKRVRHPESDIRGKGQRDASCHAFKAA